MKFRFVITGSLDNCLFLYKLWKLQCL